MFLSIVMAQISIPMSNKVGYSMYWNSMWDRKINFSKSLKEDIYLNNFVPFIFDDNISVKILKTNNFNLFNKNIFTSKYKFHVKSNNIDKNEFYKYITSLNKVNFFKSKVWVLKYQKWVVIYFFIYLPTFNSLKKKLKNIDYKGKPSVNNINSIYTIYKKINYKLNSSYFFFNKNINKLYF